LAYILRHKESLEIYATTFKNNYDLPFYGVLFWEDEDLAVSEAADFLNDGWELISVPEAKHKVINVKLNNDLSNRVTLDQDGRVSKV